MVAKPKTKVYSLAHVSIDTDLGIFFFMEVFFFLMCLIQINMMCLIQINNLHVFSSLDYFYGPYLICKSTHTCIHSSHFPCISSGTTLSCCVW